MLFLYNFFFNTQTGVIMQTKREKMIKKTILGLVLVVSLGFANQSYSDLAFEQYEKGNYQQAINLYLKDTENPNSLADESHYKIGFIYNKKLNDYKNAFKYFKLSADKYNIEALVELGLFYSLGKGDIKKDYLEAFKYWLLAYDLTLLNPNATKEDKDWLKDNLRILYKENKELISKKVAQKDDANTFYLAYMWDLCIEGTRGDTEDTKDLIFCDTDTAKEYFLQAKNLSWANYKYIEIASRLASFYRPARKGEEKNMFENKENFEVLQRFILNEYNVLVNDNFPMANIALAMLYIKGDIVEKDLRKAKDYIQKAYNSGIKKVPLDIWIKYNLDNVK